MLPRNNTRLKYSGPFASPKEELQVVQSPGLYGLVPQLGDSFNPGGRVSGDGLSRRCRSRNFRSKTKFYMGRGHKWPNMFRMPAYDPVAIAVMGFGICLAAALAFGL